MLTTFPLKSPEYYRSEAERLRREAVETKYPSLQEQLLSRSRNFDGLAATIERIIRGPYLH
jgi:hypothetical protein